MYGNYFATLCSSYETLGWKTMLFIQTPLEILVWLGNAEMSVLKWRNGKMGMFMKNAQYPSTMTTNLNLCDHTYPHMGTGLSHIICSY